LAALLLPLAHLRRALLGLALVIDFLSDGAVPALAALAPAPLETSLAVGGTPADLYRLQGRGSGPGLVLVHGLVEEGRRDPRMIQAARRLARSGFTILVPDLPELRQGRVRSGDATRVVEAVRALRRPPLRVTRVALVGISVGAGPALFAAADPAIRDGVAMVLTVGGFADAKALIQHMLAGAVDRELVRAFVLRNLDLFAAPSDQSLLAEALSRSFAALEDPGLERRLTPRGQAVARLITRRSAQDVARALESLPAEVQTVLDRLSPVRVAADLRARLLLIHGVGDPAIPFTESQKLYAAARSHTPTRLALLRVIGHVEPAVSSLGDGLALAGDVLRLWEAAYELLTL
jgi:pimeloyl-ACP methyl ester carboxylesterase